MGRKALFFDLEGTLLSRITGAVPESAVRALKKTRERGILCLSTREGRTVSWTALRKRWSATAYFAVTAHAW